MSWTMTACEQDWWRPQHFHANFYHGFMFIEDDDFEPNAELVRRFVARMLEFAS